MAGKDLNDLKQLLRRVPANATLFTSSEKKEIATAELEVHSCGISESTQLLASRLDLDLGQFQPSKLEGRVTESLQGADLQANLQLSQS